MKSKLHSSFLVIFLNIYLFQLGLANTGNNNETSSVENVRLPANCKEYLISVDFILSSNKITSLIAITESLCMKEQNLVELALELLIEKKYKEAISCLNEAIELNPLLATYHKMRGNCHSSLRNFDMAINDFKRMVLLDPYNLQFRIILCEVYRKAGRFAEAKEDMILQAPDFEKFGKKLCAEGQFEDAIHSFTWAIERYPSEESYRSRGKCYVKNGHLKSALSDFEKVVEKDRRVPDSKKTDHNRVLLCSALYDFGKFEEANKVMKVLDDFQLMMLGDELLAKRDFERALVCFTEAIIKNPNNPEYFAKRGLLHWQMKNKPRAILDLSKALIMDKSFLDCWITLLDVQIADKKYDQAKTMLDNLQMKFADRMTYIQELRMKKVLNWHLNEPRKRLRFSDEAMVTT